MKQILLLIIFGFSALPGSARQMQLQAKTEDLNPAVIKERIAKTSPEGLEVI